MTYTEKLNKLKPIKSKYADELLAIKGVFGIGLRVNEEKIVVYAHDITPETIVQIPMELEGITVEVVGSEPPQREALEIYGGGTYQNTGAAGTLGSSWYSHKYKMPVVLSNSHIVNRNLNAGGRDETVPFPLPITATHNNYYYNYEPDPEYGAYVSIPRTHGKPIISGILPVTGGMKGDQITIQGSNFGALQGKVLINGEIQQIKYWSDNWIDIIIVSHFKPSTAELKVMVRGADPLSYGYNFHDSTTSVDISEIIDYTALMSGNKDTNGNHYAPLSSDMGIATLQSKDSYSKDIVQHNGYEPTHPNYNYTAIVGIKKRIKGICREPRENLPVYLTGMRYGTTWSIIIDAHVEYIDTADSLQPVRFTDVLYYGYTTRKDGSAPLFHPTGGGMSGSSVLVADIDELIAFYDFHNLAYPERSVMEAAYKDDTGAQDISPDQFLGNHFDGKLSTFSSYGDRVANWIDVFQLEPLSLTTETTIEPVTLKTIDSFQATAFLVTPEMQANGVFSANVGVKADAYVFKTINIGTFDLQDISTSEHLNITFDLGGDITITDISFSVNASFNSKAQYSYLPINAILDGKGGFVASAILPIAPDLLISFIASAKCGMDVFAQLTVNQLITVSATFSGNTKFTATTELLILLLVDAYFQAKGQGNVLAVLWDNVKGRTHYEHIYFEITRTQDIHTEITKSIDLSLAV